MSSTQIGSQLETKLRKRLNSWSKGRLLRPLNFGTKVKLIRIERKSFYVVEYSKSYLKANQKQDKYVSESFGYNRCGVQVGISLYSRNSSTGTCSNCGGKGRVNKTTSEEVHSSRNVTYRPDGSFMDGEFPRQLPEETYEVNSTKTNYSSNESQCTSCGGSGEVTQTSSVFDEYICTATNRIFNNRFIPNSLASNAAGIVVWRKSTNSEYQILKFNTGADYEDDIDDQDYQEEIEQELQTSTDARIATFKQFEDLPNHSPLLEAAKKLQQKHSKVNLIQAILNTKFNEGTAVIEIPVILVTYRYKNQPERKLVLYGTNDTIYVPNPPKSIEQIYRKFASYCYEKLKDLFSYLAVVFFIILLFSAVILLQIWQEDGDSHLPTLKSKATISQEKKLAELERQVKIECVDKILDNTILYQDNTEVLQQIRNSYPNLFDSQPLSTFIYLLGKRAEGKGDVYVAKFLWILSQMNISPETVQYYTNRTLGNCSSNGYATGKIDTEDVYKAALVACIRHDIRLVGKENSGIFNRFINTCIHDISLETSAVGVEYLLRMRIKDKSDHSYLDYLITSSAQDTTPTFRNDWDREISAKQKTIVVAFNQYYIDRINEISFPYNDKNNTDHIRYFLDHASETDIKDFHNIVNGFRTIKVSLDQIERIPFFPFE